MSSNIAKDIAKVIQKGQVRELTDKVEFYIKANCPIRSGNMLNHIKKNISYESGNSKILIRAFRYDENVYKYSTLKERQYYKMHSHKYIMANLEKPRQRFNTYYGTGFDLERKYYPSGVVKRIKGVTSNSNFNYASHTNDARTRNKGWVFLAIRLGVDDFCAKYNGEIELWNLR